MSSSQSPQAKALSSQTSTRTSPLPLPLPTAIISLHCRRHPILTHLTLPKHPHPNHRLSDIPDLRVLPDPSRAHAQHPPVHIRRDQIRAQRPDRRLGRGHGCHASSCCGRFRILPCGLEGPVLDQVRRNGFLCCYEADHHAASELEGEGGGGEVETIGVENGGAVTYV